MIPVPGSVADHSSPRWISLDEINYFCHGPSCVTVEMLDET